MRLRRNPIELMFNKVKTEFRKYDHVDMVDDIEKAFLSVTTNDCHGFYRKTARFIDNYAPAVHAGSVAASVKTYSKNTLFTNCN